MNRKYIAAIAGLATAYLLTASATATASKNKGRLTSKTQLTAFEEVRNDADGVPVQGTVESDGLATAIISINRRHRRANIRVTFTNLEGNFTRLHLHCAPAGQNGPIAIGFVDLVGLAQDNSETNTLDANTVIGSIRNKQFPADGGACGISNIKQLADAINTDDIYWNLHTTAEPGGELRGQVVPLSSGSHSENDDD